jgi:hypothetical protein
MRVTFYFFYLVLCLFFFIHSSSGQDLTKEELSLLSMQSVPHIHLLTISPLKKITEQMLSAFIKKNSDNPLNHSLSIEQIVFQSLASFEIAELRTHYTSDQISMSRKAYEKLCAKIYSDIELRPEEKQLFEIESSFDTFKTYLKKVVKDVTNAQSPSKESKVDEEDDNIEVSSFLHDTGNMMGSYSYVAMTHPDLFSDANVTIDKVKKFSDFLQLHSSKMKSSETQRLIMDAFEELHQSVTGPLTTKINKPSQEQALINALAELNPTAQTARILTGARASCEADTNNITDDLNYLELTKMVFTTQISGKLNHPWSDVFKSFEAFLKKDNKEFHLLPKEALTILENGTMTEEKKAAVFLMLQNLIENARKYSIDGSTVTVDVTQTTLASGDDSIKIKVSNRGKSAVPTSKSPVGAKARKFFPSDIVETELPDLFHAGKQKGGHAKDTAASKGIGLASSAGRILRYSPKSKFMVSSHPNPHGPGYENSVGFSIVLPKD